MKSFSFKFCDSEIRPLVGVNPTKKWFLLSLSRKPIIFSLKKKKPTSLNQYGVERRDWRLNQLEGDDTK